MLAVHAMSSGAQAFCYFIALVAFVIAAFWAWLVQPRAVWATLVAVGLTAWTIVAFWNALALT